MNDIHLVLGASGAVGSAVVDELKRRKLNVVAVERNKSLSQTKTIIADLADTQVTKEALRSARYVYLCIGLPYKTEIWQTAWPIVLQNVIDACETHECKLIYFDNVDMYGPPPLPQPFDETTRQEPLGAKAIVRKKLAKTVLEAHQLKKC